MDINLYFSPVTIVIKSKLNGLMLRKCHMILVSDLFALNVSSSATII